MDADADADAGGIAIALLHYSAGTLKITHLSLYIMHLLLWMNVILDFILWALQSSVKQEKSEKSKTKILSPAGFDPTTSTPH